MAGKLPYVGQPGTMVRILNKVKEAQTPSRFTQDFLDTKLGIKGGTARQFIPLAKKLGFLNSDGTPSELYRKFRNTGTTGVAMAEALRRGYHEAFERNEFAYSLERDGFKGLVVEITGLAATNRVVQLICQTFAALKGLADFEAKEPTAPPRADIPESPEGAGDKESSEFDLNLSYTINLVLPKTDDPAVFNAIFRALRDNLLRR